MEFSTLNESSLHKTLKVLYQEIYEGQTEVTLDGFIYDIVTKNGNIIEIQTKNLSKLKTKIRKTIDNKHNIKIVHPVIITNTIELYDEKHNLISRRKSPKKGCIYDIFKEITGLTDLILNKNFSLEVLEINMIEERTKTELPVQSKNRQRRFKKDWIKTNKSLQEILNTRRFNCPNDYIQLLPESLGTEFTNKELKTELKKDKSIPSRIYNNPNLITWVLSHCNILKETKTVKKEKYFTVVK